jgi:hypothetical protein
MNSFVPFSVEQQILALLLLSIFAQLPDYRYYCLMLHLRALLRTDLYILVPIRQQLSQHEYPKGIPTNNSSDMTSMT